MEVLPPNFQYYSNVEIAFPKSYPRSELALFSNQEDQGQEHKSENFVLLQQQVSLGNYPLID